MGKIIEFGPIENPEYPRSISDAIILNNVGVLRDGSNMNGKSLTALINKLFVGVDSIKFLQLSDPHGTNVGIPQAKLLMESNEDLRFTVVTGDLQPTSEMLATMQLSGKFLILLGNHDVSNKSISNVAATAEMITPICGTNVSFGDSVGGAGYWHKDVFTVRGRAIRFIAFDEYEGIATNNGISGAVAYTQAQMDWFIDLLKTTPKDWYIILFHHQPVASTRTAGYSNLFTSELAPDSYGYMGGASSELIPTIVDAYLNKGTFSGTYQCGIQASGDSMTFDVDFSDCTPAKFLMHIGGHTHWDCVEYLSNHPTQLQVSIDRDGGTYTDSDLTRSDANYCINQYTINMETGDILIERIGAQETKGGRLRTSIEF